MLPTGAEETADEERPGQGEDEDDENRGSQQQEEEFLDADTPATTDDGVLEEAHGAPVDDANATTVEKMDDEGYGSGQQAPKQHTVGEGERQDYFLQARRAR